MNYKYGSRDTEKDKGVAQLQQKLKDKGYNIAVNGIYGTETQKAVTQYQAANKLKVDGIAGNETLTSLGLASQGTAKPQTTTTATQPTTAQTANQKLTQLTKGTTSTLDDSINELYERVINQKEFEYEPSADPTYNRYADIYARNAKLTSEDAMAQAAMLTGGYGSSYGQAVATQAYNAEMSKMADIIPDLRQQALAEHENERAKDIEALSLLLNERDTQRDIYESDRNYQFQKDQLDWQKEQAQLDRDEAALDRADRREEIALEYGFKSWDDYVKAVGDGTIAEAQGVLADFDTDFIDGAKQAYETKGEKGLLNYFDMYGTKYTDEQLSRLGDSVISGSERPMGVTYPSDVPVMNDISAVESYLYKMLKERDEDELSKEDKTFLKSLVSYEEMKNDDINKGLDTPDAYRRYLTWKLSEYLQERKYD